jgi:hypothetical protein
MSAGAAEDHTGELIGRALRTEGGHLAIGRGGFALHYDRGCTLSGYDCAAMKAACIARGLPVIDSRGVPFDDVFRLAVRGPMIAVGEPASPRPWHALSYAPLQAVADAWRAAGAEVVNLPAAGARPNGTPASTPHRACAPAGEPCPPTAGANA